jgi:hypothetical protein
MKTKQDISLKNPLVTNCKGNEKYIKLIENKNKIHQNL